MLKQLLLTISFLWLSACGKDDSMDAASKIECTVSLSYSSSGENSGGFKELLYANALGTACKQLVENHSGGLSLTTFVNSPSNLGRLLSLTFNDYGKTKSYTSTEGSLANGNVTINNSYTQAYNQNDEWILPWIGNEGKVTARVTMPENTDTLSYPRSITVTLKALDY